MPVELTERFLRAYRKLPAHIRAKVDRALRLLDADFRHPGLHAKRIQGTRDIYEARVDQRYRLTYQRKGDMFILRNVGPHDDALDNP
jgi:mRNA-degrading endonuclease RelE of RelBE toxin-antitoxin system